MKKDGRGFTLVELLISISIIAAASAAAAGAIYQAYKNNSENTDRLTSIQQVQIAGDWISHDTQMALTVNATGLPSNMFLSLRWTEIVSSTSSIYHTANYTMNVTSTGVGTLTRKHTSTAGANDQTIIAQYFYFKAADPTYSSNVTYDNPVLTLKLTSHVGGIFEVRQFIIRRRPNTVG